MGFLARLFNLGKSTFTDEDTATYHLADVELGYMIKYKGYDWIVNEVCTGRDFYLPYVDITLESDVDTQKNVAVSSKFTRVYEQISIGAALDQHLLDADPRRKIAADEPPKVLIYNDPWIALNDEPGELRERETSLLLSVALIADLYGTTTKKVAEDVIEIRRRWR